MRSNLGRLGGAALLALALLGCSSDDDGNGGGSPSGGSTEGSNTGAPLPTRKLGQLTSVQKERLCDDLEEDLARLERASNSVTCTGFSILEGQESQDCEARRETCIKQDATGGEARGAFTCDDTEASILEECRDVTVQEFEDCLAAVVAPQSAYAESYTCDSEEMPPQPTTPAACRGFGERCQTLVSGTIDPEA